jgi:hypothetical protein
MPSEISTYERRKHKRKRWGVVSCQVVEKVGWMELSTYNILDSLALLDGDDTLSSDLLHSVGDQVSDVLVAVGRDGSDLFNRTVRTSASLPLVQEWVTVQREARNTCLSDLLGSSDLLLVGSEDLEDLLDGSLGSSSEVHRVAT